MNASLDRVKEIFLEAVESRSPQEWKSYLNEVCGNDPDLRRQVEVLLSIHAQGASLLERGVGSELTINLQTVECAGSQIGPYKLLEQIGDGGMGVVYVAEQKEPVRRTVALKVIKPGMDTQQVVSRFEAERQALALMNHPNIAKVLDGGTTAAGRPYFVMELVKGAPITEFCDQHQLTTPQRLQLFITLCHAVQHAHQKGLIHRDLKPSNVLVEMHDVLPVPKVIDFGIAKAIGQQLTPATLHTGFHQMVGTPLYMSPEQAGQSSIDVDTRSDVYSLGVLLCELLTGTTPFDKETLAKAGYDEMRRIIREDEPRRPSVLVNTFKGQALSTISERRRVEPRKLSQQLCGELDWIVLKAIEKDRSRRYESAGAMAADVQRYLDNEPVAACPPSLRYRFRKFGSRHRVALATSLAILAALIVGTGVSLWQAVEANAARQRAEEQRQSAEASFEKALEAVDRMLTRVSDEKLRNVPQMELARKKILDDAVEFYRGFLTKRPENPELRFQTAVVLARLGDIYDELGQTKQRDAAFEEALEILEKLSVELPENTDYHVELAQTLNRLGFRVKTAAADRNALFQRAIALLEPLTDRLPADTVVRGANLRSCLANSRRARGAALISLGRHQEAEADIRSAIALCEKDPAWGQDVLAGCYLNLAALYDAKGMPDKAVETMEQAIKVRRAVVKAQPDSGFLRHELGNDWLSCGRYLGKADRLTEADEAFRQSFKLGQILVAEFPSTQPYQQLVNDARAELISLALKMGRDEEAASLISQHVPGTTLDDFQKAVNFGSIDKAFVISRIAEFQIKSGRLEAATAALARIDESSTEHYRVWHARGQLHDAHGEYTQAIEAYSRSLELEPSQYWIHKRRGLSYFRLKRYGEALSDIAKAIESKPADVSSLTWIPPSWTAACPDEGFRKGMLNLADKVIELTGSDSEALVTRGIIRLESGETVLARADPGAGAGRIDFTNHRLYSL